MNRRQQTQPRCGLPFERRSHETPASTARQSAGRRPESAPAQAGRSGSRLDQDDRQRRAALYRPGPQRVLIRPAAAYYLTGWAQLQATTSWSCNGRISTEAVLTPKRSTGLMPGWRAVGVLLNPRPPRSTDQRYFCSSPSGRTVLPPNARDHLWATLGRVRLTQHDRVRLQSRSKHIRRRRGSVHRRRHPRRRLGQAAEPIWQAHGWLCSTLLHLLCQLARPRFARSSEAPRRRAGSRATASLSRHNGQAGRGRVGGRTPKPAAHTPQHRTRVARNRADSLVKLNGHTVFLPLLAVTSGLPL